MVIVACVIGLAALTLARPRWGLTLIFFSFSFEQLLRTRPPDVVSAGATALLPPIRFSQLVTLVLCGLMLLAWARSLRLPRPGATFGLFALYAGVCLASLSYSVALSDSVRQMTIIALIGVTAATVSWWVRDLDQARSLLRAMYWGVVLHCLWALLQLAGYLVLGLEIGYYAPGMADFLKTRTFGWMLEPNWLGVLLLAVFPWFLFALDYGRDMGISRRAAIFGLGVVTVTLLLNMSRLAWLSVALQIAVWVCVSGAHLRRYAQRGLLWTIPLLAVAVAVFFWGPPVIREQIVGRFADLALYEDGRGSARVRVNDYQRLLELAEERPWLGYGVGTWGNLSGLAAVGAGPTTTFLYVLVEVGVVGLTIFVILALAFAGRLLMRFLQSRGVTRMYALAALLSVVGVCVAAWFVDMKSVLSYFPIFGLYLAVARILRPARLKRPAVTPALSAGQAPA